MDGGSGHATLERIQPCNHATVWPPIPRRRCYSSRSKSLCHMECALAAVQHAMLLGNPHAAGGASPAFRRSARLSVRFRFFRCAFVSSGPSGVGGGALGFSGFFRFLVACSGGGGLPVAGRSLGLTNVAARRSSAVGCGARGSGL